MAQHVPHAPPSVSPPSGVRALLEALYPRRCPSCGADEVGGLCPSCEAMLCLRAVAPAVGEVEAAWALAPYAGPVGALVSRAKREGDREVLLSAGELLGQRAHDLVAGGWFAAVVAAPSPWTRRVRRGFAPGHVLAAAVARQCRVPLWSVLRVRPGPRQSSLSPEARTGNLSHRLRCRPMPPVNVLLVDDVITSGTTVAHCAALLKAQGAAGVWALVLCDARRRPPAAPIDSTGKLPQRQQTVTHAATNRSLEIPRRSHS